MPIHLFATVISCISSSSFQSSLFSISGSRTHWLGSSYNTIDFDML